MIDRCKIIELEVSTLSYQETLQKIIRLAENKTPSYCCFANVHMSIEAYDSKEFKTKVNAANIVCADGIPLVKATKILYKKNIERVAGMDMMPSVMKEAEKKELKIYFYGSTETVLSKIKSEAIKQFPKLKLAGMFSPPFKKLNETEKQEHRTKINNSGANIVMVALGCPKQEKWMAENFKEINAVLLGVGGAFPIFANTQKRAPKWIRDLSMEWFYRFAQDPQRLFKRYLYTNSKFLLLFSKQLLKLNK